MTDDKLSKALSLKDDILRTTKGIEEIEHLFEQWNDLHASDDAYNYHYVDRKKEWAIITTMAGQFDSVREEIMRNTIYALRREQCRLQRNLDEYNKKFQKL
jgi:hypothetical protein